MCCDHVEGGMYIGPEFLLGQVYDGTLGLEEGETVVLYRPVYVCVKSKKTEHTSAATTKTEDSKTEAPPKSPKPEIVDHSNQAQA